MDYSKLAKIADSQVKDNSYASFSEFLKAEKPSKYGQSATGQINGEQFTIANKNGQCIVTHNGSNKVFEGSFDDATSAVEDYLSTLADSYPLSIVSTSVKTMIDNIKKFLIQNCKAGENLNAILDLLTDCGQKISAELPSVIADAAKVELTPETKALVDAADKALEEIIISQDAPNGLKGIANWSSQKLKLFLK